MSSPVIVATLHNKKGELKAQRIDYINDGVELSFLINDGYFGNIIKGVVYNLKSDDIGEAKIRLIDKRYEKLPGLDGQYTIFCFRTQEEL